MKKRFRDENGKLTCTLKEVYKITRPEADKYFQVGCIYYDATTQEEYVLVNCEEGLYNFHSFSGKKLFIPVENAGSFLPDIASEGMELILVCDSLSEIEQFIGYNKYFPEVIAIGNGNTHELFVRNNLYAGTCNELYENRFGYKFRCSYGKYECEEDCYRINSYNFSL